MMHGQKKIKLWKTFGAFLSYEFYYEYMIWYEWYLFTVIVYPPGGSGW